MNIKIKRFIIIMLLGTIVFRLVLPSQVLANTQKSEYQNELISYNTFTKVKLLSKIVCKGGYKFLIVYGYKSNAIDSSFSLSSEQMYKTIDYNLPPQPISCTEVEQVE